MPISMDIRQWSASSPPRLAGDSILALPDELHIPLPPSLSGSEGSPEQDRAGAEPLIYDGEADPPRIFGEKDPQWLEVGGQNIVCPEESDVHMLDVPNAEPETTAEDRSHGGEEMEADAAARVVQEPIVGGAGSDEKHDDPAMSFQDLVTLVRMDAYERNRNLFLRRSVSALLQECGHYGRLLPVQSVIYRRMVDCFKSDKKELFASLYAQRVRKAELLSSARLQASSPNGHSRNSSSNYASLSPQPDWMSSLSFGARNAVMQFLNRIRSDPLFLADQIAVLSANQMATMVKSHRPSAVTDSVLDQASPYSKFDPRNFNRKRPNPADSAQKPDDLSQDPLFLLIHCVFDPASQWGSRERARQLDVWSSVCARVIEDGKPGSDDFCLAVLDAFVEMTPWSLKPEFELYLLNLISSGQFITDSQASQSLHSPASAESYNAQMAAAASQYFDTALNTLIELITKDPKGSGIPPATLELIHCTLQKISDPLRRNKARSFFVSRWYCASFLSNLLLFPERYQMLLRSHVGGTVRQRLFRELAMRLQRVVFEALSPQYVSFLSLPSGYACLTPRSNSSSSLISLSAGRAIDKLVLLFEPGNINVDRAGDTLETGVFDRPFIMLFPQDVLSLAKALASEEVAESIPGSVANKTLSIASSMTGSSTLTAGTNGQNTGTLSSATPSISGTSATSNTLSNDLLATGFGKTHQASKTIEIPFKSRPSTSGEPLPTIGQEAIQKFLPELSDIATVAPDPSGSGVDNGVLLFISDVKGSLSVNASDLEMEMQTRNVHLRNTPLNVARARIMEGVMKAISRAVYERNMGHHEAFDSSDMFASVETLFHEQMAECRSRHDFQSAFFWFRALQDLSLVAHDDRSQIFRDIVTFYKERTRVNFSMNLSCQEWLFGLQGLQRRLMQSFQQRAAYSEDLRDKMWYVTDVRHSSVYEQALNVVRALKTMTAPLQPRQTGVAAWRQRFKNSFGQERVQAQVFEIIAASREHGGPNKLSDKQGEMTSRWLTQESVENFCKSEERLHRFCLEIQNCAKKLVGDTLLNSPVLWSSILYQQEKQDSKARNQFPAPSTPLSASGSGVNATFLDPNSMSPYTPGLSYPSSSLSKNPGLGFSFGNQGPQTIPAFASQTTFKHGRQDLSTPLSPGRIGSSEPSMPPVWMLPPSPISPDLGLDGADMIEVTQDAFVDRLRQNVTALLMSDLGQNLWSRGSETDLWLNDIRTPVVRIVQSDESSSIPPAASAGLADGTGSSATCDSLANGDATLDNQDEKETESHGKKPDSDVEGTAVSKFPFMEGYEKLLERFRLSSDPHAKLQALYELTLLAECHSHSSEMAGDLGLPLSESDKLLGRTAGDYAMHSSSVPRTRLTRLEEVIANCEERRVMSVAYSTTTITTADLPRSTPLAPHYQQSTTPDLPPAMVIIRALLSEKTYRPATLFRDLQMIASFVPSSILDRTAKGAAFWTFGLAAMALKSQTCRAMTARATEILTYHLSTTSNKKEPTRADQQQQRLHSPERQQQQQQKAAESVGASSAHNSNNSSPPSLLPPPMTARELAATTLEDAAHLYTLAAIEGDPTAARELGLFYLTHPQLVRRVTLSFAKPSEVFRSSLALGVGSGSGGERSSAGNVSGGGGGSGAVLGSANGGVGVGKVGGGGEGGKNEATAAAPSNTISNTTFTSTTTTTTNGHLGGGHHHDDHNHDDALDPQTFAIAFHWMEFAANAGDVDARTFLRENGDLGRGW